MQPSIMGWPENQMFMQKGDSWGDKAESGPQFQLHEVYLNINQASPALNSRNESVTTEMRYTCSRGIAAPKHPDFSKQMGQPGLTLAQ